MTHQVTRSEARTERRLKRSRVQKDDNLRRLLIDETDRKRSLPAARELAMPLTDAQRHYDAMIRTNAITFGVGPAGTGKTWFAARRAAEALKAGVIERIIITRPAVEAGESLGFLPGELEEKFEPYFRPVRDALEEALGSGYLEYCIKAKVIEARPLALLRGASIKNAWLLFDEAQNASKVQFKMLLSRIGDNAKFIVNGDPDQADIVDSGLDDAIDRLRGKGGIGVTLFDRSDIVRSGMCRIICEAYEA